MGGPKFEENEIVFSTAQMADIFQLTPRRIQQLAEEGVFVKAGRGRYAAAESIRRYIKNMTERDGGKTEVDYFEERAYHEKAKRLKTEMEVAVMKGELHRSSDVEMVMNDMVAAFRSKMLALPTKLAPQLVGKPVAAVLTIITTEVHDALTELSEYDPQKLYEISQEIAEVASDDS
jgi:phage terminase Nu1 subunit (DNA packaging protein)